MSPHLYNCYLKIIFFFKSWLNFFTEFDPQRRNNSDFKGVSKHSHEIELIKSLYPPVVWPTCWRRSTCVYGCACSSVLISFIYSSAGRSADASEREKKDGSQGEKVWAQVWGQERNPKIYAAALPVCSGNFQRRIFETYSTSMNNESGGIRVRCYLELEKSLENKEEAPSLLILAVPGSLISLSLSLSLVSYLCAVNMKRSNIRNQLVWKSDEGVNEVNSENGGREESTRCGKKENDDLWPHPSLLVIHQKPGHMWAAGWLSPITRCDIHLFTTTSDDEMVICGRVSISKHGINTTHERNLCARLCVFVNFHHGF